jgi:5-methyltetrahydrofolate--homocysteine methyltransferase
MPQTVDDRMSIADTLVNNLAKENIPVENIFVDPLVQPVSTDQEFGRAFLDAVEKIMATFPGIHTICGLSNISYGLPERKYLNRTFMSMAIAKGLDAAIVNPMDQGMMASIVAAETLAGRDEFCVNFLAAYRAKKFEF